jgi:hypothetical protein
LPQNRKDINWNPNLEGFLFDHENKYFHKGDWIIVSLKKGEEI